MDPTPPVLPPTTPEASPKPRIVIQKRTLFIILAAIILLIIASIGFFLFQNTQKKTTEMTKNDTSTPKGAIAKVGDEYIYQKDLDTELANFPGATDEATKKRLIQKLVKDSIILQAGEKDKLIQLHDTTYNSGDKKYMERIAEVKAVEKAVDSKTDQISGEMISIWFNNQLPAKIGIEKGKEEAFKRITALQKRVAAKEITMKQASELILSDPSYANLDYGYANNALIPFSYPKGKQITVDSDFDDVLWKTPQGGVTPVFLGKTLDAAGKEIEAYYIFGKVDKKIDDGNTLDFNRWYNSVKGNYDITYY